LGSGVSAGTNSEQWRRRIRRREAKRVTRIRQVASRIRRGVPSPLLLLMVTGGFVALAMAVLAIWTARWLEVGFWLALVVSQVWVLAAVTRDTPPTAGDKVGVGVLTAAGLLLAVGKAWSAFG
jgi:predicted membrane channel-forming protein YqfA (hemolysin III family)